MKNQIIRICMALLFVLCCSPSIGYTQCGPGETSDSYCYAPGEINNVAFEFCPVAGQIAQSTFVAGSIGSLIPLNTITVYEGTAGSGTGGAIVFGPFTSFGGNVLAGNVITATAPDLCLIFVINSNPASIACTQGLDTPIEVCSSSLPATTVSFVAPDDLCINAGVLTDLAGGSPAGGVYSGPGVTDNGNGTYDFDPANAGVGIHIITYTAGGNSASDDVQVFGPATVSLTPLASRCIDAGLDANLSGGSPAGGTYSGPGVTDNADGTYDFDPGIAGLGIHVITYTLSDVCSSSTSTNVEVLAACGCPSPQTSFFHCSGPTPEVNLVIFEVCPTTGSAVEANIMAGTFDGSFGNSLSVYEGATGSGTSGVLTYGPSSGDLTGNIITGLAANNCLIFVSNVPSSANCFNGFETALEVCGQDITPSLSFTAVEDLCINEGLQMALTGGLPAGGIYSGPGIIDDANGMTYTFDPAAAGVGVHTLTYTAGGISIDDNVEVFALGTAGCLEFEALDDICIDAGVQINLGGGMPIGGVYSGPGVTDGANGMTYIFDPTGAGEGVHNITYTIPGGASISDEVEVFGIPIVTFSAPADACVTGDAMVHNLLGAPSGAGGVYSGPGVQDLLNGISFVFTPANAGVGIHTLTYTYISQAGCSATAIDMISVIDDVPAELTALADLCIDAGVQASLGGGTPFGGVYSGPGVTDAGNGMTYSFDPAMAGSGQHVLTYTIPAGGTCPSSSDTDVVEVFALPIVTLNELPDYCVNTGDFAGLSGGLPIGGIYSGPGITDNGNDTYDFSPAGAGVGVHTISYTFTDMMGCTNSADFEIEIFGLPTVTFTAPADLCVDAGLQSNLGDGAPLPTTGSPDNGIYFGPGVTDNGNGTYDFDPAAAGVGVHILGYEYMDNNGCPDTAIDEIEIFALPVASFTAPALDVCIEDPAETGLSGGLPIGGVYSGTGVTDDGNGMTFTFDPTASSPAGGNIPVTYSFTGANGCSDNATDDIFVDPICCELIVDCSNIFDQDLTCRADLPPVDFNLPIISDSCGNVTLSALTIIPGDSGCPGDEIVISRTYFLQDVEGNMVQCTQTFTIVSETAPTIICPADMTVECFSDIVVSANNAVTTSDCSAASVSISGPIQSGDLDCDNTTFTYTYTATDFCNRMVSCEQVFTIENDVPTITCPADMTVECSADIIVDPTDAVVVTSCTLGFNTVTTGPVIFGDADCSMSTYTYTYTTTDDCGRTASCEQVFTIENDGPTITCPANMTVECSADINVDPTDAVVVTSCTLGFNTVTTGPVISGAVDCSMSTYTYTYTTTDDCGRTASCEQVFTIENDGPTITCPVDMTVECSADIVVDPNDAIVVTSCALGFNTVITGPLISGDEDCPMSTYTYTYTTTDDCGRTATCNQVFTIENDGPTITCPADMTVECFSDINLSPADATVATSCTLGFNTLISDPVQSGDSDCPNTTYTFTYTTTDDCGRTASCEQVFTIENVGPTIECPADMIVECFADINPMPSDATVVTSCTLGFNTVITGPVQNGPSDCPGTTYTYTYTTTDDCGRFASCEQVFRIQNAGPILTCPAPITVECAEDIVVDPTDVGVVVSCGLTFETMVFGPNVYDGLPDCPGARYVYRYQVTDECGRMSICSRDIFIDNAAPTITCLPAQNVICEDDIILDPEQIVTFTSSCEKPVDISIDGPFLTVGSPTCNGAVYEVIYTLRDDCGRTASCTQQWNLVNQGPMVVACAPDRIVECNFDIKEESELIEIDLACGTYTIVASDPMPMDNLGNCPGAAYRIDYTITDLCSRSVVCSQTWTIENDPPRVIPPDPIRVACLDNVQQDIMDGEVIPACGLEIVERELIGPIYDEEKPLCTGSIVNYLYSYWDECGRMTCEPQVIIIDPAAGVDGPEFAGAQLECDDLPVAEQSIEICGTTYVLNSEDKIIPGFGDDYKVDRTYSSVDSCGNSFSFVQTFEVKCSGPSSASAVCSVSEFGWSDPMMVFQENPYVGMSFDESNPIVIGHSGKEVVITNYKCIVGKLPGEGFATALPTNLGPVIFNLENNCQIKDPISGASMNLFDNSLLSAQVGLALNMRASPQMGAINLLHLCTELDSKILSDLGASLTILDLFELAENALMGTYTGDLDALTATIREVIAYFEGCNEASCSGIGGVDPGQEGFYQDDEYGKSELLLFPNPVKDLLMINTNFDKYEQVRVQIFSNLGDLVFDQTVNGKQMVKIEVNNYSPSLHHVIITSNGELLSTDKFLVLD